MQEAYLLDAAAADCCLVDAWVGHSCLGRAQGLVGRGVGPAGDGLYMHPASYLHPTHGANSRIHVFSLAAIG